MKTFRSWRWLWALIALALLLAGVYAQVHNSFAVDGTELRIVALNETDPAQERVGDLLYRGGIDVPAGPRDIGGLSALRWNDGKMLALTDDGRMVSFIPTERNGRLIGLRKIMITPLLNAEGKRLTDKAQADSESLTRSADSQSWLVGFERDHRVWKYSDKSALLIAEQTSIEPANLLDELGANNGLEAMASLGDVWIGCAERQAALGKPNCVRITGDGAPKTFAALPPKKLIERGSVPTDADFSSDGTLYILFRSYSPMDGNTAAIIEIDPSGNSREIAVIENPQTVDNFEGLAVRDEGEGTFLYLVSDDNFSGSQRTLLMKFELSAVPETE